MTSATETNNSSYYSLEGRRHRRRPRISDMNLLALPGITNESLTNHMIDVCEDRGDAMALIDLKNVYIPQQE